ncbi:hypothetical protein SBDP1_220002 [Syntrophobacter sp. SbD1]|nr:hypothetical protein SBDP1_220002 [Syntrophobacter sp. SbD1]
MVDFGTNYQISFMKVASVGIPHREPLDHLIGWCNIARTEIFELFAPALFRQWTFANHFLKHP